MKFIAFDLGTGGVKAALYNQSFEVLDKSFIEYETYYPGPKMHEQKPSDWWNGVIESTRLLLKKTNVRPEEIKGISLSGHSLVAIPLDGDNRQLLEQVPIWSDTRAEEEVKEFFNRVDENEWYMTTGNGFPAACYPIFKLMWLKKHKPEIFAKAKKYIGSKDFINFMLTGRIMTDYSYASGSGAYDLMNYKMVERYLAAAGLDGSLFPDITSSHTVVGKVTSEAAAATGLCAGTAVVCGGVDNACMALGALGVEDGGIYVSLGSSSWIPVTSRLPVLDARKRPYVFAHIEKGLYTSAFSIFSGGNSLRWVRDNIFHDLAASPDAYQQMCQLATTSPIGSNGIIFNPSLAGGTSQDKSINIRGAYLGLHLGTKPEDLVRAAMEGIAMNLRVCLDSLKEYAAISPKLLFCGGGSKNRYWMQMFADIFNMEIIKTNIDQDAASLGAAAIAARALGIWQDYTPINNLHQEEFRGVPNPENVAKYERLLEVFKYANSMMADLGDFMKDHPVQ